MSGMKVKDILKRNLPEFQRGSKTLDGFLEASGEFLEDAKQAIVDFDHLYDYKEGSDFNVEKTIDDRGFNMPSRINDENKRRVMRDISEIFMKTGTMDAIEHAIRLAGLQPDIRLAWVPSPVELRRGSITDPETKHTRRIDLDRYMYNEMLYGGPRSTEDGVFFYGYRYTDTRQENELGPFPIMGERYKKVPDGNVEVSSTPYLVIRFNEGNSTLVTDPVYDPETGELYEYSTTEEFDLISEVLQMLLKETHRPTTLRVVIIMYFMPFDDEMSFDIEDEEYDENVVLHDPNDPAERVNVVENFGFVTKADPLVIGSHAHISSDVTPKMTRYMISDRLIMGDNSGDITETTSAPRLQGRTIHVEGGSVFYYPMRFMGSFSLLLPQGTSMSIYGYRGTDRNLNNATLLETFSSGEVVFEAREDEFDGFIFEYSRTLPYGVEVNFDLHSVGM